MNSKNRTIIIFLSLMFIVMVYTNSSRLISLDRHENDDKFKKSEDRLNLSNGDHGYNASLGIMLCMDVSLSMTPEMVQQAQEAAYLILDLISNDTYIGLVTYAHYSHVDVPLNRLGEGTHENDMKNSIDSMVLDHYTNIYGGLTDCIEEFEGSTFTYKHILLMTDGYPNIADPGYEQFAPYNITTWTTDPDSPAIIANNSNINIHTVGFGSNYLQILLEAIASNTKNGEFYDDSEYNALVMAFAELEGWQKQETYNGTVDEHETVIIRNTYLIDTDYPLIRIWLYWDDDVECDLDLIVKDHNGDNMTSIESGGQNPPLYEVFNCTGMDYINVSIYCNSINYTVSVSYTYTIESIDNYGSSITREKFDGSSITGEEYYKKSQETIPRDYLLKYIIIIVLVVCIIFVFGVIYISKKKLNDKTNPLTR